MNFCFWFYFIFFWIFFRLNWKLLLSLCLFIVFVMFLNMIYYWLGLEGLRIIIRLGRLEFGTWNCRGRCRILKRMELLLNNLFMIGLMIRCSVVIVMGVLSIILMILRKILIKSDFFVVFSRIFYKYSEI